jgi:outer membrane protein OmpA-like peptidoglycan-associated protein
MKSFVSSRYTLVAAAIAAALLTACATMPVESDGARHLRAQLSQLQSDPQLGSRAPLAMEQANVAVTAAERPQGDPVLAAHLELIADRKISIARAEAQSQLAVDQRKGLSEQREAMRLQSRTQEADSANRRANVAQANANLAQANAEDQERQADASRGAAADSKRAAEELQKQIDDLQAKVTDRGLVLTLGDVLFASGTAELNSGGTNNLGKLATFLNKYMDRTALIEGYTDNVGGEDYNLALSQRRADSVKSYLINQGIGSGRLTTSGKGKSSPVADNTSATGRQQNRRVEVIIENVQVSSR